MKKEVVGFFQVLQEKLLVMVMVMITVMFLMVVVKFTVLHGYELILQQISNPYINFTMNSLGHLFSHFSYLDFQSSISSLLFWS
jgi:hypothetical protein